MYGQDFPKSRRLAQKILEDLPKEHGAALQVKDLPEFTENLLREQNVYSHVVDDDGITRTYAVVRLG